MTDFASFAQGLGAGRAQLVTIRLVADLETLVSAYLKLGSNPDGSARQNSFLLESVQGGETRGRYSIIGLKPDLIWRTRGNVAEINRNALNGGTFVAEIAKPLKGPDRVKAQRLYSRGYRSGRRNRTRNCRVAGPPWLPSRPRRYRR